MPCAEDQFPAPAAVRLSEGLNLLTEPTSCQQGTLLHAGSNPLLPVQASDARGQFNALSFVGRAPLLVEVVHSLPGAVRGNHKHLQAEESFHVLSGELDLYLGCSCGQGHVWSISMRSGDSLLIPPGVAHAMYSRTRSEVVTAFTGADPRNDRVAANLIAAAG